MTRRCSKCGIRGAHTAVCPEAYQKPKTNIPNPKDAIGSLKYPLHWVSQIVMGWVGVAMMEGARKYGGHNYRAAGVRVSVNYTAARHHIDAFWEGQDMDPDTDDMIHHIPKAIAALTVLYDGILQGNFIDDRPVRNPDLKAQIEALNAATKAIAAKYPNPVEPFTEIVHYKEDAAEAIAAKLSVSADAFEEGKSVAGCVSAADQLRDAVSRDTHSRTRTPAFQTFGEGDTAVDESGSVVAVVARQPDPVKLALAMDAAGEAPIPKSYTDIRYPRSIIEPSGEIRYRFVGEGRKGDRRLQPERRKTGRLFWPDQRLGWRRVEVRRGTGVERRGRPVPVLASAGSV